MIEDVRNETDLLVAQKKRLTNALDATEAPLHIANECIANRNRRYGEDRVYDAVEIALLKEVEIINNVQNLLRKTIMTAEQQIRSVTLPPASFSTVFPRLQRESKCQAESRNGLEQQARSVRGRRQGHQPS